MRTSAVALAIGLIAAACSDDTGSSPEPVDTSPSITTVTTVAPPTTALSADRAAAIAAWTNRPLPQILGDGFDTGGCAGDSSSDDTVLGLGWAFLPLPLEVVELEREGDAHPAVVLSGTEVFPNPTDGYSPTHAWIDRSDLTMLAKLTENPATTGAEVVLGIGATDQGRSGRSPERPALASFAWLLTDEAVIPFNGECDWITAFSVDVGEPLPEVARLRTDAYRRAELAGLTGDEVDFGDCRNLEIGLGKRVGFGGDDVGLAFGPWPADAATFTDIELDGWTVLPPAGEEAPEFAVRGDDGFPDGDGLDPDGWLFTFTVEEGRALVQTLYHADAVLGLRIWSSAPTFEEGPCFEARQVIAFREFLDDRVPTDRPAWDLSPALPGDESLVVETLGWVTTDEQVRARFREWTPCTYKLCEANDEVVR